MICRGVLVVDVYVVCDVVDYCSVVGEEFIKFIFVFWSCNFLSIVLVYGENFVGCDNCVFEMVYCFVFVKCMKLCLFGKYLF